MEFADGTSASQVNDVLEAVGASGVRAMVPDAGASAVAAALDDYYVLQFADDVDVASRVAELQQSPLVVEAYEPPAAPPPPPDTTPDFGAMQTYFDPAPVGVNRAQQANVPGGDGSRVKVVDVEYGWNLRHEDVSKARDALVPNGTPVDPFDDNNHGTAVLGELVADDNGFGVNGLTTGATLNVVNTFNRERGWDIPGALAVAESITSPGDVVLIEQQTVGPNGNYVPVEWDAANYAAIMALTDAGRVVVEAGANGGQNLDDKALFGKRFPQGKKNSGAIIVGAGEACAGSTNLRSRLSFSNYGRRVDVQGPGDCVVTTGYGGLYGDRANSYYTATFAGTSSASPIVAAAAASVSSSYLERRGKPLLPKRIRSILERSGTPQDKRVDKGNIGPLPNLAKALPKP